MSDSFEDQKKSYEKALEEIKSLKNENTYLKNKVLLLETKFDTWEQKEKANNLIIVGIPKQTESNTTKITKRIFESMQIVISEGDIKESYRINKQEDSMILVKFEKNGKKREIFRRVKEMKGLTVKKCGLEGKDQKIYLNDDMTTIKRKLFQRARDLQREKGYKAAYTRNGSVFVKKKEGDVPIKIISEEDLRVL